MTSRQTLINTVAQRIAKTTDYHMKPNKYDLTIKVVEITTDENETYVTTTTDEQWKRYEIAVLKKAEQLHWDRYHTLFS